MRNLRCTIALVLAALFAFACVPAALAADQSTPPVNTIQLTDLDRTVIQDILNGKVTKNADGTYHVASLNQDIPEQAYVYYMYVIYNKLYSGTVQTPSVTYPINYWNPWVGGNQLQKIETTMNQYETMYIGAQTPYTYTSSDPTKVLVTSTGVIQALKPTDENEPVFVFGTIGSTTYFVYIITVKAAEFSPLNCTIDVTVMNSVLTPRMSTTVYAVLLYNGTRLYTDLVLSVDDPSVASLSGSTLTAKKAGTVTVTATMPSLGLTGTTKVYVYDPTTGIPTTSGGSTPQTGSNGSGHWSISIDNGQTPVLVNPSFLTNGTIVIPVNGTVSEALLNAIDSSKYNVRYLMTYVNGVLQPALVLVPKTETPEPEPEAEPQEPAEPQPTAEEIAAQKAAEEEAARQKALEERIAQAKAGKLDWDEIYMDLYRDSYYVNAVDFVLTKGYMTGKTDTTFAPTAKVTFADVRALFIAYLKMSETDFDALGFFKGYVMTKQVTRQELATLYAKLAAYKKIDTTAKADLTVYEDYGQVKAEHADAYAWAIGRGIINKTALRIMPETLVDRARLAQTLYNFNSFYG